MEIRNVFETRKSIRSYTGEAIPDVVLERILKVANISPVARGLYENVHLTIITSKEYLAKIEENAGEVLNAQGTKFLYGAPMLILVSANADNNVAHSNAASLFFFKTPEIQILLATCFNICYNKFEKGYKWRKDTRLWTISNL